MISVSQLLDEGFEVRFKKSASRVLDSTGDLVFGISRVGKIFGADFGVLLSSGPRCFVASSKMSEFQLWHRRLGHVGFDHLMRIGSLDLLRGLPKLKATKDIVCAPCRHGKQVSASHPPINLVNTTRPAQLLHMDTVGPARVRSAGGKWYVLVIVDDFSLYSWVFFMEH